MLELQRLVAAAGLPDSEGVRIGQLGDALDVLNLAVLHELARAAREPCDDGVLEVAQLGKIDARLAELDAPRLCVAGFIDELGHVQQRLRRYAPPIDAHATGVHFGIDERGREPEIGGQKRGSVTAGPAAHDDNLSRDHGITCNHEDTKTRRGRIYPCSARRNGCSSASTTQRRNRIPSAPSIAR